MHIVASNLTLDIGVKWYIINVKRNDCGDLNIVRFIDSEPSFKTTPPHMLPTQSHQTECYDLLYILVRGSAAMLQTHLQHFKANVCVNCVPDYVHMTR